MNLRYFLSFIPRSHYLKYNRGDLNVILSAPHGGSLKPLNFPSRTSGKFLKDTNTLELIELLIKLYRQDNKEPYFIYSELHRSRVDLNRDVQEASGGNVQAQTVWKAWNSSLSEYTKDIVSRYKRGLLIDIHSQSATDTFHLGYNLTVDKLNKIETEKLKRPNSSISSLRGSLKDMIFGEDSIKTSIELCGYRTEPFEDDDDYYNGGRNTQIFSGHGIGGIQVECPVKYLKSDLKGIAYCLYYAIEDFRERFAV